MSQQHPLPEPADEASAGRPADARRVVLADPDETVRMKARRVLQPAGFDVVADAATARETIDAAISHRPNLMLIEIEMLDGGVRAISEIGIMAPEITVVVYTRSRSDEHLLGALRAGATGYWLKDADPERLPAALEGQLNGEASIPRQLMRRVLADYSAHPGRNRDWRSRLTQREWDVLELMRHGFTTQEIASRLFVAPVTVRSHVLSICRKLDVPDRAAAVRRVEEP